MRIYLFEIKMDNFFYPVINVINNVIVVMK